MKISTILDHIDSGHMALPEFQRGYVWNREQVRGLIDSLYRRHPVGSLLVWATGAEGAPHRGSGELAPGVVKLLLDGQQRITSLYGLIRGRAPKFFDGNDQAFRGLHFHVAKEEFSFFSPVKMKDDPLWVDVTNLLQQGLGPYFSMLSADPANGHVYLDRLNRIHSIREIDLHIDEVTGEDKTVEVVVEIFNKVNSGGTKLSKGDLALAKICADSPDARERMKSALARWRSAGYDFNLDWLLRNVNTVVKGEAKFHHLHKVPPQEFRDGLVRAERSIDFLLNLIGSRLGIDHDRVFFGRYALPTLVHYVDRKGGGVSNAVERDRLLFWFLHSAMWGRYSGSTESVIDRDLKLLEDLDGGVQRLIDEMLLWHGALEVQPAHFSGWSLGARFYPVLYLLTRIGGAKDWGSGIELRASMLGKMSALEVHHVFPRAFLYKHKYRRAEVNAIANFCFLTKTTNLKISARPPEQYFEEIENAYPGALASQWVPTDRRLWKVENYRDFLEARRELLAKAANEFMGELFHGPIPSAPARPASAPPLAPPAAPPPVGDEVSGGIDGAEEEEQLQQINAWVRELGLPPGLLSYELADEDSGAPVAVLDLAWPDGIQPGLSQPLCVLLNEPKSTLEAANGRGFRYFTTEAEFRRHVEREVLGLQAAE